MTHPHDCATVQAELVEYLYGFLDAADRAHIAGELARCPACRDCLAGFEQVRGALDTCRAVAGAGAPRAAVVGPRRVWRIAAALATACALGLSARAISPDAHPARPIAEARSEIAIAPPTAARPVSPPAPATDAAIGTTPEEKLAQIRDHLEAVLHMQLALQRLTDGSRYDSMIIRNEGGLDR